MDLSKIRKGDKVKVLTPKPRWLTVKNYIISGRELKYLYTHKEVFTSDQIVDYKPE